MVASFIITLRETLEAALIIGIVISFLKRTKQYSYYKTVWYGAITGVVLSIIGSIIFNNISGGFSGRSEELFEGITMIIGSILITTMIIWVMQRQNIAQKITDKISHHLSDAKPWGIFFMVLVAVLREGIETVIFLQSASMVSSDNNLIGALLGIVIAIILGIVLYMGSLKINLKRFFAITGILLILFAAGLLAHGMHELQEVNIIPVFIEEVWNINPTIITEGVYPLLHEKGHIGSFMKGLFGYNGNPTLIESMTYILYLIGITILWHKVAKKPKTDQHN